jgi:hydroxypyruvate reductase
MTDPVAPPIEPSAFLRALFDKALEAADPARVVPAHLPEPPAGRTVVVGAGKASAAMARALERHWPAPLEGLVVTRTGHGVPCEHIEIAEASHPVPDEAGRRAAGRILELVRGCGADDLVIALISGGGSALLALPAEGITLEEKQAVNRALLASGARIDEMNCLRKHLSAIKGGRLAAAADPARLVALLISDVPGDDPSVIASGPTVADPSTRQQALEIIDKYAINAPPDVMRLLQSEACETPKPGDPRLARVETRLIARPQDSLEAATRLAADNGVMPLILSDSIEGEAREVAIAMAAIARQAAKHGQPAAPPCVLLSGGETTVTLRAEGRAAGRGGRNSEFLLSLAIALDGLAGVHAIACDTDGIDGSEDNAGAIIGPASLDRAARQGLSAKAKLRENDSYGFFAGLGDLVVCGPTLTNVNDFRAILIEKRL